jgi:hypothetical protein
VGAGSATAHPSSKSPFASAPSSDMATTTGDAVAQETECRCWGGKTLARARLLFLLSNPLRPPRAPHDAPAETSWPVLTERTASERHRARLRIGSRGGRELGAAFTRQLSGRTTHSKMGRALTPLSSSALFPSRAHLKPTRTSTGGGRGMLSRGSSFSLPALAFDKSSEVSAGQQLRDALSQQVPCLMPAPSGLKLRRALTCDLCAAPLRRRWASSTSSASGTRTVPAP